MSSKTVKEPLRGDVTIPTIHLQHLNTDCDLHNLSAFTPWILLTLHSTTPQCVGGASSPGRGSSILITAVVHLPTFPQGADDILDNLKRRRDRLGSEWAGHRDIMMFCCATSCWVD